MTADEVVRLLQLQPHPVEGGFFRETYRSVGSIPEGTLPGYAGSRSVGTAIYYLLTPQTVSEMHRLPGDEVFHFYAGDAVEMLQIAPDGTASRWVLGTDFAAGHHPQLVVTAGTWQGSALISGGQWALLGATMAPGFDYQDYVRGTRTELAPHAAPWDELLIKLTPHG
ncbi:MAG: cupin domain-containing protein [Zavarzinella sp.]